MDMQLIFLIYERGSFASGGKGLSKVDTYISYKDCIFHFLGHPNLYPAIGANIKFDIIK